MRHLIVSAGRITTVTLNRPAVRNALNDELIAELTDWATDAAADRSIRVVVIQGAGPVFCAGADLTWMSRVATFTHDENLQDARRAARLFHLLDTLPAPLIGRVHGAALGGGSGLAAICDVVVAERDALFGFTETTLGIVPAMISPYVVRKIGLSAARALCLSGVRFSATHALTIGLVQEVVPAAQLDAAVRSQAEQFDRAAPSAVAATKRLLAEVAGRRPGDLIALTAETIAAQRVSPEGQEGIRAFLDKRIASWSSKGSKGSKSSGRSRSSKRSGSRRSKGSRRSGS
jgi:methylglutaconyl-CoA hydratase